MATDKVWVRNSQMRMYADQPLDPGQVFNLRNQANDSKLLRHEYVVLVDEARDQIVQCIGCGREFIDVHYRDTHARRAQHEAVVVGGPQLKAPKRPAGAIPASENAPWDLEPEGAPPPTKAEETGVVTGQSRREFTGKGVREVFKLG